MVEKVQIAALKEGAIELLSGEPTGPEAVLALPLDRFVAKILVLPQEAMEDPVAFSLAEIKRMSPFPDEELTVSVETVAETEGKRYVFAAALPEGSADDIAEALDAAKLQVTRVDALVFGVLRMVWGEISSPGRRIVLLDESGNTVVAVFDGAVPCSIRSVPAGADMRRETMFGLLEAEEIAGAADIAEVVAIGGVATAGVETFAPVRAVEAPSAESVVQAIAERSCEEGAFNALPETWREVLEETRFKKKLRSRLAVAGAIWALAMAVLFGGPVVYGFMTDRVKGLSKEHSRRYVEVSNVRDKVNLVRKYSDHSTGALEILKAVGDCLPEGVELSNWDFRRGESVRFNGEAEGANPTLVYEFLEKLRALPASGDDADGDRLFAVVDMRNLKGKGSAQTFSMECKFVKEDAE